MITTKIFPTVIFNIEIIILQEDAFWCLVYIVENLMPSLYYCKQLVGVQVDQVNILLQYDIYCFLLKRFKNIHRKNLILTLFIYI